jgi:hypothetical protein
MGCRYPDTDNRTKALGEFMKAVRGVYESA